MQLQQETAQSPCLRGALSEWQTKRTSMEGSSPCVRYAIGAARIRALHLAKEEYLSPRTPQA